MPPPARADAMLTALDDAPDGELRGWREEDWRALLADLPTDGATFAARFERTWDEHLVRTAALFTRLEDAELRGYVGLLVLTLQSLRHSERHRSAGGLPGHDCDAVCRPLVRDPAVREAIRRLYRPGGGEAARAEWDHIDFSTLEFHRHGTTSFILTGRPLRPRQGQLPTFALKCIVYPFLRMPTIGRATRSYAAAYDLTGQPDVQHLVHVWASDDRWILMDFVTGETLAELLARELGPAGDEVRLDLLDGLGRELFHAMAELDRCGLRHGDLSPSNIIVTTYGTFKLIDLGVNYLYTHAVTGVRGPDAGYVAPEVVAGEDATRKADLYSVGQLLVTFGGVGAEPDGVVPDPYYSDAPELARFVEDLTDRDPRHRQLIFPGGYDDLRRYFLDELAAVRVARGDRPAHPTWLRGLIDLCRPLLGMPSRQRRLWRLRRKQGVRGSRRGAHVRWLLGWSLLSAASWYLAITVVVIWWLRDLNLDWGNQAIAVLQRLTGTPSDQFPYLDSLRAADYPIPDLAGNLPVRLTALSFAIVAARYYQGLFAGITPLAAGWRAGGLTARAVTAEVFMRMGTVLPVLLILPATLVERRWWPLLTAVGMTYVFLANWSAYAFTRAALRRARLSGLSTVRGGRAAWLTSFAQWTPASLLYAVCVWVIGVLIYSGELADVYFYACGVATVNIALWYAIKLGRNLAPIRAGLTRACLAAERARHR